MNKRKHKVYKRSGKTLEGIEKATCVQLFGGISWRVIIHQIGSTHLWATPSSPSSIYRHTRLYISALNVRHLINIHTRSHLLKKVALGIIKVEASYFLLFFFFKLLRKVLVSGVNELLPIEIRTTHEIGDGAERGIERGTGWTEDALFKNLEMRWPSLGFNK